MYKINSLIGVGDYLWAAYNTGMVHVYDTRYSPWITKKDWRAHDNPVISLVADRSSFWTMDRSQILSLGADNVVRLWDGLLQDDWLGMCLLPSTVCPLTYHTESDMQSNDVDFCKFEEIKAVVMTWNAGASTPYGLRYNADDADFMKNLLQEAGSPDILIFGFQELIDLEDKKTTASKYNLSNFNKAF
jgi:WD40 repeat protein